MDYEELILDCQESEDDECITCPYKGNKYNNQCMRIEKHYNPYIMQKS